MCDFCRSFFNRNLAISFGAINDLVNYRWDASLLPSVTMKEIMIDCLGRMRFTMNSKVLWLLNIPCMPRLCTQFRRRNLWPIFRFFAYIS